MTRRHRIVAVGLKALMATSPLSTPARAQISADCVQQFEQIERETRAFYMEVDDKNLTFVGQQGIDATAGAMKRIFGESPTIQAALTLREHKQKWDQWRDLANGTAAIVEEFVACLKGTRGVSCDVTGFAKRHSRAYRLWFQQLLDEGLASAIDRASEAAALVNGYIDRTLNMGMQNGLGAVDNCVAQFEQSATTNNAPFDSRAAPSSAPPASSGGGTGVKILAWTAAITGIGVGTAMGIDAARTAGEEAGRSTSGGSNTGTVTTTNRATTASACGLFSCAAPNSVNARVCTGCLNIIVGSALVPGSRYVVNTLPSSFHATFTAGSVGSGTTVEVRTTLGSACPGPQTQVGIFREFQVNTSVAAFNVAPINVTCR